MNGRTWLIIGALVAGLGIGLGALGAHFFEGLAKETLYKDDPVLQARRIEVWNTAVEYQMYHGLAILAIGLAGLYSPGRTWNAAGGLFLAGTVLFSGSLYLMALSGVETKQLSRFLIYATPLGGILFLVGWAAMLIAAAGIKK